MGEGPCPFCQLQDEVVCSLLEDQGHIFKPWLSAVQCTCREDDKDGKKNALIRANANWHRPTPCTAITEEHTSDRAERGTCIDIDGKSSVQQTSMCQCFSKTVHPTARYRICSHISPYHMTETPSLFTSGKQSFNKF